MGLPQPVHLIDRADTATAALTPLRLRILRELVEPDSAAGLARRVGVPRQKLNYHLRQLEKHGLLEVVGERRKRNCTERLLRSVARTYLVSPVALGDLAADPARMQDHFSSAYLVAVAAQAMAEVGALREEVEQRGQRLPTLTLQTEVRFPSPEAQAAFAEDLANACAEVVARYHDAHAAQGRTFRLMVGAWPAPGGGHRKEQTA